jgi:hypothetical protein
MVYVKIVLLAMWHKSQNRSRKSSLWVYNKKVVQLSLIVSVVGYNNCFIITAFIVWL